MARYSLCIAAIAALLISPPLAANGVAAKQAHETGAPAKNPKLPAAVPGKLIVKFRRGIAETLVDGLNDTVKLATDYLLPQ